MRTASQQTWLLVGTGALLVFYFVLDIRLGYAGGMILMILWFVSFYLDIKSTFSKPELFSYESNMFLAWLCKKEGKIFGSIVLGATELLLILVATILFVRSFDWTSYSIIAACVANFHLLWFTSNRQFASIHTDNLADSTISDTQTKQTINHKKDLETKDPLSKQFNIESN